MMCNNIQAHIILTMKIYDHEFTMQDGDGEAGSHTTLRSFTASVRSRKSSETTSLTFRKECISLFLAAFALPPRLEQKSTSLTSSGTRYASTESKLALMSSKTSDRSEASRHTRFTTNFPGETERGDIIRVNFQVKRTSKK